MQHGLACAVPEHVGALGADQRVRARPVVVGGEHQVGAAADHGEGAAAELPLGELGGAGQLVGDGWGGHEEVVAVVVAPAGEVLEDAEPGGADGDVGLALAPRPARGVGDDDGHGVAGQLAQPCPQSARRTIRVDGQQHDLSGRHVGRVDPRRGQGEAVVGAHDPGRATPGDDPGGLAGHRLLTGPGHDPALRLADDLAGHEHDVTVGQPHEADEQRGQVVTPAYLAGAVGGEDGQLWHGAVTG